MNPEKLDFQGVLRTAMPDGVEFVPGAAEASAPLFTPTPAPCERNRPALKARPPSYLNSRLLGYVTIGYIEPSSQYLGNWSPRVWHFGIVPTPSNSPPKHDVVTSAEKCLSALLGKFTRSQCNPCRVGELFGQRWPQRAAGQQPSEPLAAASPLVKGIRV